MLLINIVLKPDGLLLSVLKQKVNKEFKPAGEAGLRKNL